MENEKITERKRKETKLDTDVLFSVVSVITMGVLGIALLVYLFFL